MLAGSSQWASEKDLSRIAVAVRVGLFELGAAAIRARLQPVIGGPLAGQSFVEGPVTGC